MNRRFCIDTSVFINGWNKRYRKDVFPTLWEKLDAMLTIGSAFSCHEVYLELTHQADELAAWAKERRLCFEDPSENTILTFKEIIHHYPNFAAVGGAGNDADPWVIAHAKLAGAVVVTDEQPAPTQRPTKPPKIPDVCEALEIKWMPPIDFFAANNWSM